MKTTVTYYVHVYVKVGITYIRFISNSDYDSSPQLICKITKFSLIYMWVGYSGRYRQLGTCVYVNWFHFSVRFGKVNIFFLSDDHIACLHATRLSIYVYMYLNYHEMLIIRIKCKNVCNLQVHCTLFTKTKCL